MCYDVILSYLAQFHDRVWTVTAEARPAHLIGPDRGHMASGAVVSIGGTSGSLLGS